MKIIGFFRFNCVVGSVLSVDSFQSAAMVWVFLYGLLKINKYGLFPISLVESGKLIGTWICRYEISIWFLCFID
ncbi:MAG: hypothetical protein CMK59_14185 [Proteobacteria bacterium]|nr:hypothetical protein [Pseudomonadota bacterium]